MAYDTPHVRTTGETLPQITDIDVVTDLIKNAALASLYTAIRSRSAPTGPELIETTAISKKTVYAYLCRLQHAGLITAASEDGTATVYAAREFTLSLQVHDVTVSITPELVQAFAHRDQYPVIDRVLEDHGLTTFALAHDLVTAHDEGEVTIRQLAELTGLSTGTAYDIVEAIYAIDNPGGAQPATRTYMPADIDIECEGVFDPTDADE